MTELGNYRSEPVDPDPGQLQPTLIALVGLGGGIGTLVRYAVSQRLPAPAGFPWPTFAVNLVGALILGLLLEFLTRRGTETGRRRQLRLLLGTGLCGGLTTYSTLAVEFDLLERAHRETLAVTYGVVSLLAGLVVVATGIAVGARTARARR